MTLSSPFITNPVFISLVPKEKLLAYQLAFDLVEGGAQYFLEATRNELPEGEVVSNSFLSFHLIITHSTIKMRNIFSTLFEKS